MDNFQRYEALREQGVDAHSIYRKGQSDELDSITLIRMIRKVCNLSLAEAKKIAGQDEVFEQPQPVHVGAIVSWDLSGSDGNKIRRGSVLSREGDDLTIEVLEEYDMDTGETTPVLAETKVIPSRYFQMSLVDRLEQAQVFWKDVTRQPQH